MKLNVVKKVGNQEYVFQVEGDNLHAVLMESKKLSFRSVPKCGLCESDWLYLTAYTTKEQNFDYVKVCCAKCGGSVTFGKTQRDPDTYYLRKNDQGQLDWKADERKEGKTPSQPAPEGFSYSGASEGSEPF